MDPEEVSKQSGVSSHLQIPLEEYDSRIRTFVPFYEEVLGELEQLVALVAEARPTILDLGIGTGAAAERCLLVRPEARVIGVDSDSEILEMARARLHRFENLDLRAGSFLEVVLPAADLIVASLSFHHVASPREKRELYLRCRRALGNGGIMLLADCFPPFLERLALEGMENWRRHLERSYPHEEAVAFLDAWSEEDTYFPMADEIGWLSQVGFRPEVVWRRDLFAILLCR
jgi:SAM-dependent methyltransferase